MRTALSLFAAAVIGVTMLAPATARAQGLPPQENPQIAIAIGPNIGGPPGSMIFLAQTEYGCPVVPEGVAYQDVHGWMVDAAGVETDFGPLVRTNADGTWPYSKWVHIPFRTVMADLVPPAYGQDAAPGFANIYAKCVLSTGVVTQNYWPAGFNVGGIWVGDPSWPFRVMTPTIEPGGTVQIESNNEDSINYKYRCWTGVEGTIFGHGYSVPFTVTPDGGMWSTGVVASVETDDVMVPLPAGTYTIRANCKAQYYPGQYGFTYADQLLTIQGVTPPTATCKDVIFIAVPGSGQTFDGARNISVTPEVETAYRGFKKVLTDGKTIRLRVLNYPALPVETINSLEGLREYLTGKNVGVRKLRELVAEVRASCPNQAIVLAGYSQGALVVHEYMVEHDRTTTGAEKQAITAAVTIADPAQIQNSPVLNFGDAPTNAMGICQYTDVKCFKAETFGDIPQVYQNRTTTVCKNKDVICDFNHLINGTYPLPGAEFDQGVAVHLSYADSAEVVLAGKRAARQVNRRW